MRRAALTTFCLVVALGLSGCVINVGTPRAPDETRSDATIESTTPAEVVDVPEDAGIDFTEVQAEATDAVDVVETFWETHWADFYTGTYAAPVVVGFYDGYDPNETVTCGGEIPEAENAFYCIGDDAVMWDKTLMEAFYAAGDANVYLIIAHEWGHAIQARLDPSLVWEAAELQADCFAGATLFGAAADGVLTFEDGDAAEIANGLTSLSDQTAWTSSADHGDPFDRIDAFNSGRTGGVNGCFPTSE